MVASSHGNFIDPKNTVMLLLADDGVFQSAVGAGLHTMTDCAGDSDLFPKLLGDDLSLGLMNSGVCKQTVVFHCSVLALMFIYMCITFCIW